MPTSVKHFTSAQTGAPVVSNTKGSRIAMLDAVLVNGFGLKSADSVVVVGGIATVTVSTGHSACLDTVMLVAGATPAGLNGEKRALSVGTTTFTFDATGIANVTAAGAITVKVAPAGWTKVFSGTDIAVYRSADVTSTQTYLRVDDTNASHAIPVCYLSMTDIDTGTSAFSGGYWVATNNSAGTRAWWVAANKSKIYLGIKTHGQAATDGYSIGSFGDLIPRRSGDPYCCTVSGAVNVGANWAYASKEMSPLLYSQNGGFAIARSYTQLGGSTLVKPMGAYQSAVYSGSTATIPFPNGGDNSVLLSQAECAEYVSGTLRGRLPGLYFCPQAPNGGIGNDFPITDAADFPGKTLLWKLTGSSFAGQWGGCAIDVIGPWE